MVSAETEELTQMLTRLKLTAIRDQLDSLLDTATRRKLTLLDTVKLLCEAEVARKDERRIQMASSIAKFPFARTLEGFEFAAQPSLDAKLVRELATCRWVGNGDALLLLGHPASAKRISRWHSAAKRSSMASRPCSRQPPRW
jgi:DNA replication protein DnaC